MRMAKEVATWSKDPSSKIGAVAVGKHGQILSTGYNGFPRGIKDLEERWNNRPEKYKYVVHAEMNAIYNATLNGVSLLDSDIFVYGLPICKECAKGLIQSGVKRIFIHDDSIHKSIAWKSDWDISKELFNEAGVQIEVICD